MHYYNFWLSFILLHMQATIIANQGRVSVHETTEDGESLLSLACSAGYYELAQVSRQLRIAPKGPLQLSMNKIVGLFSRVMRL